MGRRVGLSRLRRVGVARRGDALRQQVWARRRLRVGMRRRERLRRRIGGRARRVVRLGMRRGRGGALLRRRVRAVRRLARH